MRVLLAVVSLMFALALSELAARLFLEAPPRVVVETQRPSKSFEPRVLALDRVPDRGGLYLRTPTGLRLRPNTRAVLHDERLSGRTIEIRTNSLGYRGPEVSARDGTRVLVLGDSITFANYLDESETFVQLVEDLGERRGRQWNTINAGVGTISLGNELAILEETGLSVEPDLVVLAFYLNDFHESPGVFIEAPPPALAWSRLARIAWRAVRPPPTAPEDAHALLFEAVRGDLEGRFEPAGDRGGWRRDPRAFEALVLHKYKDWGGAWAAPAWAVMTPLLEELHRLSLVHDFELVFVAFPVRFQVEAEFVDDRPQRRLAQVAASLDVPMLDLLAAHRDAMNSADGDLFYDHCHHTPRGARIVAQAIVDFLVAHTSRGESDDG